MDPCASCGKPTDGTQRCGACRAAFYCGAACQRLHWRAHKPLCAAAAAAPARADPADPGELPTDEEAADATAAPAQLVVRLMREAATGGTDAQLLMGDYLTSHAGPPAQHAQGRAYLAEALRKGHPGAPYALGRLAEGGAGGVRRDAARAAALYRGGFAATRHVGCAVGLHSLATQGLPEGGEGLAAAEARLIALAAAPDTLALAAATGSRSCLGDAMWSAAEALKASAAAAGAGAEASGLLAARTRALDIGAAAGDPFIMAEVAEALIAPRLSRGVNLLLPSERGEALCAAVLAAPRAAAGVKSLASSLLGSVAHLAYDAATARRRYLFAVDVCAGQPRAISKWALMHLPMYLFEGLGGPAEPQRARAPAGGWLRERGGALPGAGSAARHCRGAHGPGLWPLAARRCAEHGAVVGRGARRDL